MKGGIIALPGLSDAPVGPANGVLAALSGPALAPEIRTVQEEARRDREIRTLVEAALRKLEEGPP